MTLPPIGLRQGVMVAPFTSLKAGGPAEYFLEATSIEEMASGLAWARAEGLPVRILGGGSNVLVAPAGIGGLLIRATMNAAKVVWREGAPVLVAGSGANIANVARRVSKDDLAGLEWASNVPGTVGGATVNNAGAFGGDMAGTLEAATVLDGRGEVRRLLTAELAYGYRSSVLKRRELGDVAILEAELRLSRPEVPGTPAALVRSYQSQRTRTQPRQLSAGSVFANPPGTFAGKLVEESGLKGSRIGGAEISQLHANFIVNTGGALPEDVLGLMRLAQQTVYERTGTWLQPEIELLGRWSDEERAALRGPLAVSTGGVSGS